MAVVPRAGGARARARSARTVLEQPGFKGEIPVRVRLAIQTDDGASTPFIDELACDDRGSVSYASP